MVVLDNRVTQPLKGVEWIILAALVSAAHIRAITIALHVDAGDMGCPRQPAIAALRAGLRFSHSSSTIMPHYQIGRGARLGSMLRSARQE